LLLEADNEADRRKYALLYAQLETSNEQKIHRATKAVKEAVKELYGENPKLFAVEETVSTQLASKFSASPPPSQKPRLSLYIKAIDCNQCDAEFKKAYAGVPSMYSGIDVYFVGVDGNNEPMIAWARAAKLTKDEVLSGKVTINHAEKNLLRSLFLSCLLSSASAHSSSLMESFVKDTASELGVDGTWLWRICTHESKTFYNGSPQPWPFTLNYKKKGRYFHSHQGALYVLRQILEKDGSNALVDVGMCQVNLRWHGDKVASPEDLLDFRANVRIAAGTITDCP